METRPLSSRKNGARLRRQSKGKSAGGVRKQIPCRERAWAAAGDVALQEWRRLRALAFPTENEDVAIQLQQFLVLPSPSNLLPGRLLRVVWRDDTATAGEVYSHV